MSANNLQVAKFSADCCVLCSKNFAESMEEVAKVHSKGLETLIRYSSHTNEDLCSYMKSNPDIIRVHIRCRKEYTRLRAKSSSETDLSSMNPPKKLRSQCDAFVWQNDCFFCTKPAVCDERHPERNPSIHFARTLQFRDSILALCDKRLDPWALQVKGRLQLSNDFPASDAVYHASCYKKFYFGKKHPATDNFAETGRPEDGVKLESFNKMCDWFESSDTLCSISDMRQHMLEEYSNDEKSVYSVQSLKRKLVDRYGDHMFFAEVQGRADVVCLQNMASFIINAKWYTDRKEDLDEESARIIVTAAKLIRSQIREATYSKESYPTAQEIADRDSCKAWVPPALNLFTETLIADEVKQISISHSIVQSCCPRSAISPVLFGLGVQLDHLYRSKYLVNELCRLGMCISYDEVSRFKQSVIRDHPNDFNIQPYPISFTQWVADNVDHNTKTLDGLGTFHGMGIIAATTTICKPNVISKEVPIKRVKRASAREVVQKIGVQIRFYCRPEKPALSSTIVHALRRLQFVYTLPPSCNLDLLWYGCWLVPDGSCMQTNWSGFQQHVNIGAHPPKTDVTMMPIIDINSSDEHCIFSTLNFVQQQAKSLGIVNPCITFDQPLWLKAVEIVRSTGMNIVCRLGGFHTLMSFLGSIGTLMGGSGIADALDNCYGPNAVIHMMSGKAVSRALRGHFLVDAALTVKIMKMVTAGDDSTNFEHDFEVDMYEGVDKLLSSDIEDLNVLLDSITDQPQPNYEELDFSVVTKLDRVLCQMKANLSISRTAKLWILYMDQIATVKMFIRAERTGNWNLHLIAMTRMLNLFAATGHNNYAKSARLYLQMMQDLPNTHPWLFDQFSQHGFHVVRRSDRYWAGLWTDLVIEQTMMKCLKGRGGLTHGSGMTETVRHSWISTLHKCATVHQAMTELSGLETQTTEKHSELGKSRARRDVLDLKKIMDWLDRHDPFKQTDTALRSISSGLTATTEAGINCDMADDIGRQIHVSMDGKIFSEIVLKKKTQVKTLMHLQKPLFVNNNKKLFLSNNHLFSRLIVLVERTAEMAPFFEYELTPLPSSMFKDSFMRKPDKAALGKMLYKNAIHPDEVSTPCFVLDGGSLLHKVSWPKVGKYSDIVDIYAAFVNRNYGSDCCIVFDGYNHGPSTKDHEHQRRSKTSSAAPDIAVHLDNPVYKRQEAFLGNGHNKAQLINILKRRLLQEGHSTVQAANDADTIIVKTAIDLARLGKGVIVVGEDTDVLILLVHHLEATMPDVFMLSSAGVKKGNRLVSIRGIQMDIGVSAVRQLLVVHALTGCDTTSALFHQGKVSAFRKIIGNTKSVHFTHIIGSDDATQQQIHESGSHLLSLIYGGKAGQKLNALRYSTYVTMCASTSAKPLPERLPPTDRAAYYHCLRVHYQVLQWKKLSEDVHINPIDWGWTLIENKFQPIPTDAEPAPADLLKVVRCMCKSASRNQCASNICTCRKNGLRCVTACGGCHGESCMNSERIELLTSSVNEESPCDAYEGAVEADGDICFYDDRLQWMGEEEEVY